MPGLGWLIKLALWGRIKSAFAWVQQSSTHALIALCVVLALWGAYQRSQSRHWHARYNARAEETDRASREAAAAAVAQVKMIEAKSAQNAEENVHVAQAIRTVYVDRGSSFADRMRLDKVCRRDTPAPTKDIPAPVDNGPGPDAVVLERKDFDVFVENTARLKAVHEWGEGQIRDGLAVPLPDPAFGQ